MANQATVTRLFNKLQEDNNVKWFISEGEPRVVVEPSNGFLTREYATTVYKRIVHCKNLILEELSSEYFLLQIAGFKIGGMKETTNAMANLNTPVA